jgi:hypothetical protein
MENETPLAVARAWQDAVNRRDAGRLLDLSAPDVEISGPRGTARGRGVLEEWLGRAGLALETRRAFAGGGSVVLAQHGVWRSAETGAVAGEAEVASCFRIADGRLGRISRHDDLDAALEEARLSHADEVPPR